MSASLTPSRNRRTASASSGSKPRNSAAVLSIRAHDVRKAATAAAGLLTDVHTVTLAGAPHHTLPQTSPAELNRLVGEFIARSR